MPSEPNGLSELLMHIKTSVRNVSQHHYFCIQHCHFVNSTRISDDLKDCVLISQTKLIIYTQDIFCIVFQFLLIVC